MSEPKEIVIAEIQNLTVPEVEEFIPLLTPEQLEELRALEAGSESPRKGVLNAIAAAQPSPPEAEVVAEAAADETPDWKTPDYTGPLDIEKAEWRRHNIKPVGGVSTK